MSSSDLVQLVEHVAHFLPAQGPIGVFIHHNTLHAFEDEPFDAAVVSAARRFGCEPFLAEDVYRDHLRRGRIAERDLDAVIAAELGARAHEQSACGLSHADLWRRVLVHGIPEARGTSLAWVLGETDALDRFREDLPVDVRELLDPETAREQRHAVRALWQACVEAIARSAYVPETHARALVRHRDLLVEVCNVDPDAWTRPVQIRFVGAYLDQGWSHWAMPERERGLYACFCALYSQPVGKLVGSWGRYLAQLVAEDRAAGRDAVASLARSLDDLGIAAAEREELLVQEALALRGWAGMVRQLEERPDRVPAFPLPARLVDYLAVQLLLSRAALHHAIALTGLRVSLAELRPTLRARLPAPAAPSAVERAWPIFHAAQLAGLTAPLVAALDAAEVTRLEDELAGLDGLMRRKLFHHAFERHLRCRFYDALAAHVRHPPPDEPAFQAIFCLDDREESMRRHLEEIDPRVETFSTAGFFGVAMYYRGAHAAHARPLCPIAIKPASYVTEVEARTAVARLQNVQRRVAGSVDRNIHVGSRTIGRGAVITALLGALWMIPLVLRVLFPWSRRGISKLRTALSIRTESRLDLEPEPGEPPLGSRYGFDVDECARIVHGQLATLGIANRFAPLVFAFGHGSTSLNNPQQSAYDCGACGGGRGGPNARAFAQMANDPRVRAKLAELGLQIPDGTWFVGGQRNTASNDLELFDLDQIPDRLREAFEAARDTLDEARRREAHERCRRFESAPPSWFPDTAALLHVQARAADLAQPRTECGHATNAFCLVGRRARTRGLFLDRRAFLVSYDPTTDPDGTALARVLAAVVPVCVGISLEYFFGFVDPTGYGCGTKLPHNVTSLLGVMDGAQSDLRTGLPWQMVEIHEPVRLPFLVEARPEVLARILAEDERLAGLVERGWMYLASLDPDSGHIHEIGPWGARPYVPEQPLAVVRGTSRTHYAGHLGHLAFVRIEPRAGDTA